MTALTDNSFMRWWPSRGESDKSTRFILGFGALFIGITYAFGYPRWTSSPTFDLIHRLHFGGVHVTQRWYGVLLLASALLVVASWRWPVGRMIGYVLGAVTYTSMGLLVGLNFRWSGMAAPSAFFTYLVLALWFWQSAYRVSFVPAPDRKYLTRLPTRSHDE